jgi:hypothetical protein
MCFTTGTTKICVILWDKCCLLAVQLNTLALVHIGFKLIAFTFINLREFCGG